MKFFGFTVIVAGAAWVFTGSAALMIAVAASLLFLRALVFRQRRQAIGRRMACEPGRYEKTRLIRRQGLEPGQQHFPHWVQKHRPLDWCDGWGSVDGSEGCDGDIRTHMRKKQKKE